MGYIGQDEDHLESPGTPSCDSLQTSNPMQSSGLGLFVWDDHGSLRFADAGVETTRRREPRGVSGTFEVSPTGSIPRRENPAWQVTNDKVEASRAMLFVGQKAPTCQRPLTRVAV